MKIFILISSLLSINSYAFDFTLNNEKDLSDLMYLPDDGVNYLELSVGKLSSDSSSTVTNTGLKYSDSDLSKTYAGLTYGRGMEGGLFVSVDIDYDFDGKDSTIYGSGTTVSGTIEETNSKGVSDPRIKAKYRFIEQSDKGYILDLDLGFSPKTGDAETASTTKDGNNFRGGHEASAGISFGKKYTNSSFSLSGTFTSNGSKDVKSLDTGDKVEVSTFSDFSLSGITQFQPNNKVFLNVGLNFSITGDREQTSGTTTTIIDTDSSLTYTIAGGYRLGGDTLLRLVYNVGSVEQTIRQGTTVIDEEIDVSEIVAFVQVEF